MLQRLLPARDPFFFDSPPPRDLPKWLPASGSWLVAAPWLSPDTNTTWLSDTLLLDDDAPWLRETEAPAFPLRKVVFRFRPGPRRLAARATERLPPDAGKPEAGLDESDKPADAPLGFFAAPLFSFASRLLPSTLRFRANEVCNGSNATNKK